MAKKSKIVKNEQRRAELNAIIRLAHNGQRPGIRKASG